MLGYAARAIELAGSEGARLEAGVLRRLEAAKSNDPEVGSAARVLEEILEARTTAVRA